MTLQLIGADMHNSPLLSVHNNTSDLFSWSPYGGSTPRTSSSQSLPGFNGERPDPLTSASHLGNGYRAYNPFLRRFTCPDNESPFGVGGINPYAYCSGDPVNQTDPSGHGPLTWLLEAGVRIGLRIGLEEIMAKNMLKALKMAGKVETHLERFASVSTGVSSAVMEHKSPQLAAKLSWASFALGLPDAICGSKKLFSHLSQMKDNLLTGREFKRPVMKNNQTELDKEAIISSTTGRPILFPRGYTNNFMGKGEDALLLHGNKEGKLWYGTFDTLNHQQVPAANTTKGSFHTVQELVDHLFDDHGIDLRASQGPIHLLSCYAKRGAAQALANATGREVIAYSKHSTITYSLDFIENPDYFIRVEYRKHDPRRKFKSRHRAKPRSFLPRIV
ncbi:RHS repeat-associated core domain-containing protein [Salmonella enterica subsp. salamae]|nr:RHS repeat-associated core domain-containing protein [Salmonella enterica subsp. salamae]EDW4020966.1 RHS repeat-associated core domain-containing protein [Salmonella enterica subsp. salamae]